MCVCVVVVAALVVVIDFANGCFRGLGWRSSGRRAGDDDGRGDDAPACVGWFRRRTSAWTQGVRCRALDLWLRWRVFDWCFDGLRGASW